MSATITIDAKSRKVLFRLQGLQQASKKALRKSLYEIGFEVVKEARRLITTGKRTGKWYTYKGRPHQASDVREPPANRSGRLAKSGDYKVHRWNLMTLTEKTPYSGVLEYKMDRPHWMKAMENKSQEAVNIILDNMKRRISR